MGYDPLYDLPRDHLARLVEIIVEESIGPPEDTPGPGQSAFDPRLCAKSYRGRDVLIQTIGRSRQTSPSANSRGECRSEWMRRQPRGDKQGGLRVPSRKGFPWSGRLSVRRRRSAGSSPRKVSSRTSPRRRSCHYGDYATRPMIPSHYAALRRLRYSISDPFDQLALPRRWLSGEYHVMLILKPAPIKLRPRFRRFSTTTTSCRT